MRLKTKFEKFVETTKKDFRNVSSDMRKVFPILRRLEVTQNDFIKLRHDLANNGVVRNLRMLEKRLDRQEEVSAKLDAIIEYLGVEIKVEEEKLIPEKLVAKKIKAKKGKK